MNDRDPIVAAGAVVLRRVQERSQVLLVHRPKYDDWSFPKGKLDPGESEPAAAVREVREETGLDIRLGPALTSHRYEMRKGADVGREKVVHWWVGRVRGSDDVADYRPNEEIDGVAWVDAEAAGNQITYPRDRQVLAEALLWSRRTGTLLVVRHGHAVARKEWDGVDSERPLTAEGEREAEALVPLLEAYGVERVVTSTSRRCWTTVAPYAGVAALHLEETKVLSEEAGEEALVAEEISDLLDSDLTTAVCTHRPVLPWVFEALGLARRKLEPGGVFVAHHRRGAVVSVDHHDVCRAPADGAV